MTADIIYPDYIIDDRRVHYNEDQRWYWLPDQTANNILVFGLADTEDPTASR